MRTILLVAINFGPLVFYLADFGSDGLKLVIKGLKVMVTILKSIGDLLKLIGL